MPAYCFNGLVIRIGNSVGAFKRFFMVPICDVDKGFM